MTDRLRLRCENRRLRRLVLALAQRCYLMSTHLTLIAERGTRTDRLKRAAALEADHARR